MTWPQTSMQENRPLLEARVAQVPLVFQDFRSSNLVSLRAGRPNCCCLGAALILRDGGGGGGPPAATADQAATAYMQLTQRQLAKTTVLLVLLVLILRQLRGKNA